MGTASQGGSGIADLAASNQSKDSIQAKKGQQQLQQQRGSGTEGKVIMNSKLSSTHAKHLIDHSQLFIEPSPRNLMRDGQPLPQAAAIQQQLILRPQGSL